LYLVSDVSILKHFLPPFACVSLRSDDFSLKSPERNILRPYKCWWFLNSVIVFAITPNKNPFIHSGTKGSTTSAVPPGLLYHVRMLPVTGWNLKHANVITSLFRDNGPLRPAPTTVFTSAVSLARNRRVRSLSPVRVCGTPVCAVKGFHLTLPSRWRDDLLLLP
jgi:hypothetical protein